MAHYVKQYEKPYIRRMIVTDNPVCIQSNKTLEKQQSIQLYNCTCPIVCACMCDYPCICPSDCPCPSPCSCPCGSVSMSPKESASKLERLVSTNRPMKLNPSFRVRKEYFGGLLFDSIAMCTYVLNKAAYEIIDLMHIESLPSEILELWCGTYKYPTKTIPIDFREFLSDLFSMGALIEYEE